MNIDSVKLIGEYSEVTETIHSRRSGYFDGICLAHANNGFEFVISIRLFLNIVSIIVFTMSL
jgi:hypothetical protein